MLLLTSGCATISETRVSTECRWVLPIRPSKNDVLTTETKRQILAHDDKVAALCNP